MKSIFEIDSFEQQCVIIKWFLHSIKPEKHVVSIGVDQLLSNCELYEHICLEISRRYTEMQLNMMIYSITIIFMKQQWYQN